MKKFLLKVFLPTIIIVLTFFVGLEIYIRSLPNDFKEKNQYLESNAKRIKIMVLGDSGASMDIMPGCFTMQPSYNFAYHSQDIEYSYWILCKYFEEMDSLKYVLMNIGMGTLWGFDKNTSIQYRKKFYKIYYGYPGNIAFEVLSPPQEIIHRIWPANGQQAVQTIDSCGYQCNYYEDIPYDEESWTTSTKASVEFWHNTIQDEKKYNDNIKILREIIEKCKEKDVNVILFTTPSLRIFYDNLSPAPMERIKTLMDTLMYEYPNVMFFDYTKSDTLFPSNEMWYNATHLNKKGTRKFSLMINDIIMNIESEK